MSRRSELEISTVIVKGERASFKAALSRSILGVTFKRFKRRKTEFYKHRVHNEAVTESVFDWLYESLLKCVRNIGELQVKTNLKPEWDENGKILGISDISVSVYMKVGELTVDRLQVHEKSKNVKIDLFYSEIDARSKKLRLELPKLMESWGKESFEYSEHDFLPEEGRKLASAYKIEAVPTILINAEKVLVDPDENKLRQEIERAFTATVRPSSELRFITDPSMKPNVEILSEIKTKS
jgi:hypothetical protein